MALSAAQPPLACSIAFLNPPNSKFHRKYFRQLRMPQAQLLSIQLGNQIARSDSEGASLSLSKTLYSIPETSSAIAPQPTQINSDRPLKESPALT